MSQLTRLIERRSSPGWRLLARIVFGIRGIEIPASVKIGAGFKLPHGGHGVVIHPVAEIGNSVTIYHRVTIGRVDAWKPSESISPIQIGDGAIICTGAVVLGGRRPLSIGRDTIVGANAVLTRSTGPGEIWAGVPAERIGFRDNS